MPPLAEPATGIAIQSGVQQLDRCAGPPRGSEEVMFVRVPVVTAGGLRALRIWLSGGHLTHPPIDRGDDVEHQDIVTYVGFDDRG